MPGVLREHRGKQVPRLPAKRKNQTFYTMREGSLLLHMDSGETVLVNTVDYNISKYSERDYTRGLLSQKLHYKIALPNLRNLVNIVRTKCRC